jgi:CrcB protein
MELFLICLAGGIGSGARHLLALALTQNASFSIPIGTLSVNVIGSFLICLVMPLSLEASYISPTLRLVLTAGFLGGFTTYSSFSYETIRYLSEGEYVRCMAHIAAMLISCMAAGGLGLWVARKLIG